MKFNDVIDFFEEIHNLLLLKSDQKHLSKTQETRLAKLIDWWNNFECPEGRCTATECPYAKPIDWVEFHGYTDLHDLISHLDATKAITEIPSRKTIDPLKAPWARRPGHFSP